MPRPHRQSARSEFGISSRPYESYFPKIPSQVETQDRILREHPYLIPYAVNNPYGEQDAADAGQAQAFMDQFDPEDPEQITGLQRLVGQGKIDPRKANAMFGMADRIHRENDRQTSLARRQAEFDWRKQQAEAKAGQQDKQFQRAYASAIQAPTDEQKVQAAMKLDKSLTQPGPAAARKDTDPWAQPEPWSRAWHSLMDPKITAFRSQVLAAADAGKDVHPELVNWAMSGSEDRPPVTGMPQASGVTSPAAMGAQQRGLAPQSTEAPQQAAAPTNGQGGFSSVRLPNGTVRFGPSDQINAFKAKYGLQ